MKKRKIQLMMLMLLTVGFISCKDQAKDENETASQPTNETSVNADDEKIKVNPAHGLPGHRCDLPVGAPLNGQNTSAQTQVEQLPSTSVSPIRVDQTPDVNPPHGEPGHDCSVPVGAKLN